MLDGKPLRERCRRSVRVSDHKIARARRCGCQAKGGVEKLPASADAHICSYNRLATAIQLGDDAVVEPASGDLRTDRAGIPAKVGHDSSDRQPSRRADGK